ncbi:putative uncharacterized protein [Eubacterium sp. CAG:786]|nr:putative uncharacterized protein [Eubacterium sp. CAG:786]
MITFKNGSSYNEAAIYGAKTTYQSAERDTLDIVLSAEDITLDEAKKLWQNADATSEITIDYSDEETTKSSVHINYTLPMALTLDTLNGRQVVHLKLAQKSQLELTQEKQAQDMDDVNAALCELAEIIAGGENNG